MIFLVLGVIQKAYKKARRIQRKKKKENIRIEQRLKQKEEQNRLIQ